MPGGLFPRSTSRIHSPDSGIRFVDERIRSPSGNATGRRQNDTSSAREDRAGVVLLATAGNKRGTGIHAIRCRLSTAVTVASTARHSAPRKHMRSVAAEALINSSRLSVSRMWITYTVGFHRAGDGLAPMIVKSPDQISKVATHFC